MEKDIVSIEWLKDHLQEQGIGSDLIVLEAVSTSIANPVTDDQERVIPGARQFKIKASFCNKESVFPNTVPSAEQFQEECRKLGINRKSKIVVYDQRGIYFSPRVWWLFKLMGHEQVAVLNGGMPAWLAAGKEAIAYSEREIKLTIERGDFESNYQADLIKSYEEVLDNTMTLEFLLVDARSEGRFKGTAPEPREHLLSGSISQSINIPFDRLLKDGKLKTESEIQAVFRSQSGSPTALVYSCGSGLTACILALASKVVLGRKPIIFDGSWTEWAERQKLFSAS